MIYFVYLFTVVLSTIAYCWLHKKTHISLHYLYKDNILDILVTCYVVYLVNSYLKQMAKNGDLTVLDQIENIISQLETSKEEQDGNSK